MGNYLTGLWEFIKPTTILHHKINAPKAKNCNFKDKKVLVTGGSKGIGLNVCKELAKNGVLKITIMARNVKIMEEACVEIRKCGKNPNLKVDYHKLDQANIDQIKETIDQLMVNYNNYDVIMLNAGVITGGINPKTKINNCFEINHLGTFCFGNYLVNSIRRKGYQMPERILITSSSGMLFASPKGIDTDDVNILKRSHPRYNNFLTKTPNYYFQSKLANHLYTVSLSRKLPNTLVHSIHPGCVTSDIRGVRTERNPILVFFENLALRTDVQGAQCHVHVGFSEDSKVTKKSGLYFDACRADKILKMDDFEGQLEKVWAYSVRMTGVDLE